MSRVQVVNTRVVTAVTGAKPDTDAPIKLTAMPVLLAHTNPAPDKHRVVLVPVDTPARITL